MIRPFQGIHPQIHETAFIADSAQVIGDVHVGEQASIWFGTVARGDMYYIRIGDRSNVQDNCVLHTRTGEKADDPGRRGDGGPQRDAAWLLRGTAVSDRDRIDCAR
jgi:carbonic anhydrase/acetyltransferase-like protein (isoleucine patch superfamily)